MNPFFSIFIKYNFDKSLFEAIENFLLNIFLMKIQSNSDEKNKFEYEIFNNSLHARFYREICKFKVSYFVEEENDNDNDSVSEYDYDYEYSDDNESDNDDNESDGL